MKKINLKAIAVTAVTVFLAMGTPSIAQKSRIPEGAQDTQTTSSELAKAYPAAGLHGNTGAPAQQSVSTPRHHERVEIFEMAGGDMIIEFRQTKTGQSVVTFKEIEDVP
jgi:hypothetical protein